jgi:hypothetical protein
MMQAAMWLVFFVSAGTGIALAFLSVRPAYGREIRQSALPAAVDKSAVKLQSMRPRVAFGSSSRRESFVRLWRAPPVRGPAQERQQGAVFDPFKPSANDGFFREADMTDGPWVSRGSALQRSLPNGNFRSYGTIATRSATDGREPEKMFTVLPRSPSSSRDCGVMLVTAPRCRPTPSTVAAPQPPRSQTFGSLAKGLQARAPGLHARRMDGRLIDRASRANERPAGHNPVRLVPSRRR